LLATALPAVLCWAVAPICLAAQAGDAREYQIKAAFLFNFGQFVTWRPETFAAPGAPFVIGVLGDDPFGNALDAIAEGGRVQGRPVRVARYRSIQDVTECQILFVSSSVLAGLDGVFAGLRGRNILTVGEVDGFADRSGMIRFFVVDRRIRLEINRAAAEDAGLTISSRLLSLAAVVRTEEE
jgi:hypothetical protein